MANLLSLNKKRIIVIAAALTILITAIPVAKSAGYIGYAVVPENKTTVLRTEPNLNSVGITLSEAEIGHIKSTVYSGLWFNRKKFYYIDVTLYYNIFDNPKTFSGYVYADEIDYIYGLH